MNLHDIIIERSPLATAIRVQLMRAELAELGYEVVKSSWLRQLNETILKRKLEDA